MLLAGFWISWWITKKVMFKTSSNLVFWIKFANFSLNKNTLHDFTGFPYGKIVRSLIRKQYWFYALLKQCFGKNHVLLMLSRINNVKQPQVRAILSKSGYRFCGKGLRQNKRLESISVQFESKMLWRVTAACKTIIARADKAGMVETYPRLLIAIKGE